MPTKDYAELTPEQINIIRGKRISDARKAKNMSQVQLAKALETTKATISRYESGSRTAKFDTAVRMAKILGVSVEYLMLWPEDTIHFIPKSQMDELISGVDQLIYDSNKSDLISAFDLLNNDGQEKAVESVRKIAAIPKYQKQEDKIAQEKPQAEAQGDKNVSESDTE